MVQIVRMAEDKQVTCYQCKSVLSYKYTDMEFSIQRDYSGGCDRVARITCPVCGCKPQVPLNY